MKYTILILSFLSLVLLGSCNSKHKPQDNSDKTEKNDSLVVTKTYHPGGGLWKVTNAKRIIDNGEKKYIKHGEVLSYYKTPKNKLSSKSTYIDGKREGIYSKYYISGNVYYETPYFKGKKNGIKKTYYENGKLLAETPYKNGSLGIGTKEYTNKGILIKEPTLKLWYTKNGNDINVYAKVLRNGKVTKRVTFYEGLLVDGKYYHNYLKKVAMDKNGVAKISFYKNPEVVSISAKVKSAKSIYTLINKTIKIN